MIALGLVAMAAGNYWMAQMNLQVSFWHVIWPRMVLTLGLGLMFAPASVAAYKYIPPICVGRRSDCSACSAPKGAASVLRWPDHSGTATAVPLVPPGRELGPAEPPCPAFLEQSREYFLQWTGDPARSQRLAVQALDDLRQQQAASMAFFDIFWGSAPSWQAFVPLVLLMKRSVAAKGEHVSAH